MVKTSDFESENSGSSPGEAATMVERVARAIEEAQQMHWNDMARAAIAAMREPTDSMVKAPYKLRASADDFIHKSFYQAMIDEALK
jgi:hypothetical protein